MKKAMLVICLMVFSISVVHAEPQYVVIKQTFWGPWRFKHVEKPKKKEHRWYYDEKTDTYYRMNTFIGLEVRIKGERKKKKNSKR